MNDFLKLMKLADAIESVQLPVVESELGQRTLEDTHANLRLVAAHLRVDASVLRTIAQNFPEEES